MEYLCKNCKYIDYTKVYHNIFDDDIWYGCKRLVRGHTRDTYNKFGVLVHNGTDSCCYEEERQIKFDI